MKSKYILALILLLGLILRFFILGQNPPSLNWDETSIGYNAYSILKTGKDEYGNFLPIEFRSFDDFKPPVYIYLTVPSIAVFGLTEFAVRFPAALFGTLAIIVLYLLIKEIFDAKEFREKEQLALIGSFLLAVSPWHLQFSRTAYEGNIGLFFLLLALLLFYKSFNKPIFYVFSTLSFIICIYSYHSFRLVVPIFIVALILINVRKLVKNLKIVALSALIFLCMAGPIYIGFFAPQGSQSRLSMVSIFSESDALKEQADQLEIDKNNGNIVGQVLHNRRAFFLREAMKNYLDHFNPNFLFVVGAGSFHHHAKDMGMMYLVELPFLFLGLFYVCRKFDRRSVTVIVLLLIAPLPAALTTGTPHGVRAITMIPGLIILTAGGFYFFKKTLLTAKRREAAYFTGIFVGAIALVNFIYYINQYYDVTPREYGYFWEYGNKEAILSAKELEGNYSKIVMTYKYDQPYIYYLFYNKIDPAWYQQNWDYNDNGQIDRFYRKIGKYEFRNIDFNKDKNLPNTLLIGTESEIESEDVLEEIVFPDGRVAYKITGT